MWLYGKPPNLVVEIVSNQTVKAFYEAGTPIALIEKATGLTVPEIENILSD